MATFKVNKTNQYDLSIDEDEAQFLRLILGNFIVGTGKWRRISDGIWDALDCAALAMNSSEAVYEAIERKLVSNNPDARIDVDE